MVCAVIVIFLAADPATEDVAILETYITTRKNALTSLRPEVVDTLREARLVQRVRSAKARAKDNRVSQNSLEFPRRCLANLAWGATSGARRSHLLRFKLMPVRRPCSQGTRSASPGPGAATG